jgi:hypothetical protein
MACAGGSVGWHACWCGGCVGVGTHRCVTAAADAREIEVEGERAAQQEELLVLDVVPLLDGIRRRARLGEEDAAAANHGDATPIVDAAALGGRPRLAHELAGQPRRAAALRVVATHGQMDRPRGQMASRLDPGNEGEGACASAGGTRGGRREWFGRNVAGSGIKVEDGRSKQRRQRQHRCAAPVVPSTFTCFLGVLTKMAQLEGIVEMMDEDLAGDLVLDNDDL